MKSDKFTEIYSSISFLFITAEFFWWYLYRAVLSSSVASSLKNPSVEKIIRSSCRSTRFFQLTAVGWFKVYGRAKWNEMQTTLFLTKECGAVTGIRMLYLRRYPSSLDKSFWKCQKSNTTDFNRQFFRPLISSLVLDRHATPSIAVKKRKIILQSKHLLLFWTKTNVLVIANLRDILEYLPVSILSRVRTVFVPCSFSQTRKKVLDRFLRCHMHL